MDIQLNGKTSAPSLRREPIITDKDRINEYWSKDVEVYHKSVWQSIQSEQLKKTWQGFFKAALGDEKMKILDVGTGPGIVAFLLADMGHTVTGVDRSEEMLKRAKENSVKLGLPVEFRPMDAENLTFDDESFDAVINRHVLWTLTDPERALQEWKRVLKPGGRLIIIDGNWYMNINSSIKNQAWRALSLLITTFMERRNAFRRRHDREWEGRLPLANKKRPEYDIEMLKSLGFETFEVTWIKYRDLGLLEHLKYGFFGDTFQLSTRKG